MLNKPSVTLLLVRCGGARFPFQIQVEMWLEKEKKIYVFRAGNVNEKGEELSNLLLVQILCSPFS